MAQSVLDGALLHIASGDFFTVRDATQGVLVTGGIGSGKTSGSGATLRAAYLQACMGGLVLCAKPEEADAWRAACAQHGRRGSLIELDGRIPILNFITY